MLKNMGITNSHHVISYPILNLKFYIRNLKPLKPSDIKAGDDADNGLLVATLEALSTDGRFREVSRTEYLPWTTNPRWKTLLKGMYIFQNQQPCRINIYHVKSKEDELMGLLCVGTAECDLHEFVCELGKAHQYSLHLPSRGGSRGDLFIFPTQAPAAGGVLEGAFSLIDKKTNGKYITLSKPIENDVDQPIYTSNTGNDGSKHEFDMFKISMQMLADDNMDQVMLRVKLFNDEDVKKMLKVEEQEDEIRKEKYRKEENKKKLRKLAGIFEAEHKRAKELKKKHLAEVRKREKEARLAEKLEKARKKGEDTNEPVKITRKWKPGQETKHKEEHESDSEEHEKDNGIVDLLDQQEKNKKASEEKNKRDQSEEEDSDDEYDQKKRKKNKKNKKKAQKEEKPKDDTKKEVEKPEEEKDPKQIEEEKEEELKRRELEEEEERKKREKEELELKIKREESHYAGVCQMTAREVIREGMVKRHLVDQKGKVIAGFQIVKTRVERRITLCDYFMSGLQIEFHVGIDFTAANNDPFVPISLHYHHDDKFNKYESCLNNFGALLTSYNYSKQSSVYGFGQNASDFSNTPNGNENFFTLNTHSGSPYVIGVNGLLDVYKESTRTIELAGTNDFSHLIRHVRNEQNRRFTGMHYYGVLLLLVRNDLSDEDWSKTKKELLEASKQAITIIIVGMLAKEEEKYENLSKINTKEFDKTRGNVAFVTYEPDISALASKMTLDIPSQIGEFCQEHDFIPELSFE